MDIENSAVRDPAYGPYDDQIDFAELFKVVWLARVQIVGAVVVAGLISVAVSLMMPNVYRSEVLLMVAQHDETSPLAGLASQYAGLVSGAGKKFGGLGGDRSDEGLAVLKSRQFMAKFMENRNLLPALMAVDHWDPDAAELVLDGATYVAKTGEWAVDEDTGATLKPSPQEAYKRFMEDHFSVAVDRKTGFVTLGVQHVSPVVARDWTSWLVEDLNETIRLHDIGNAQRSIKYLQQELEKTVVADLQAVFFQLIEGQMKTVMLANARDEYLFRTLDPAVVPERKISPHRSLICIVGAMLGGMFGLIFVLVRYYFSSRKEMS